MTNKEILQANLLDIIFENRNKEYGAYALRNEYDKRLLKALGIGLGLVLLLVLINFLKIGNASPSGGNKDEPGISISVVNLPPEKIVEPEKPKPIEKPKVDVAKIDYQEFKITPDKDVKEKLADLIDIENSVISNTNSAGIPENKLEPKDLSKEGTGTKPFTEPEIVETKILIRERAPEYPGGTAALIEFMKRNLVTPEDLEIGDKKIVRVKFVVGKDGSITDITILESPGKNYEKEVSRVVKKMPKWKPGIQNDMMVAVAYVLPVTFIGVEE